MRVCDTPMMALCLLGFWVVGLEWVCVCRRGGVSFSLAAAERFGFFPCGCPGLVGVWWWFENSRACLYYFFIVNDCQFIP
ncbi:hypothetical protein GFD25_10960, partial [Bifidobacterium aerophilum]|nr:hypothetical protein [Bifidobacterium aerophilum]